MYTEWNDSGTFPPLHTIAYIFQNFSDEHNILTFEKKKSVILKERNKTQKGHNTYG